MNATSATAGIALSRDGLVEVRFRKVLPLADKTRKLQGGIFRKYVKVNFS